MVERGLVAEDSAPGQITELRLRRGGRGGGGEQDGPVVAKHAARRRKALAADREPVGRGVGTSRAGEFDGRHREFIAGERAGLVGGDQRAAAEALDRRQPPHDGAAGGHPAGGDGQCDRQRHGQSLGDRRHGQHHREEEHLLRSVADHHAEESDQRGGCDHRHGHRPREAFHAGDQRRLAGGPRGHVDRQLSDACAQARGDDDRRGATAGDDRACVHHVELVGQRRGGRTGPGGFLPHRQRFAGE